MEGLRRAQRDREVAHGRGAEAVVSHLGVELPPVPVGLAAAPPAAAVRPGVEPGTPAWLRPLAAVLHVANRIVVGLGMIALLAASVVLTSSVVSRYFLKASTDWQDEA